MSSLLFAAGGAIVGFLLGCLIGLRFDYCDNCVCPDCEAWRESADGDYR